MIVIPAIDLRDGHCVRLTQGRKSDVTFYNANPVAVARQFVAAGAELIHVVDLDGAFSEGSSLNRAVLKKIVASVDARIEFGGGIRSVADVQELCDAGVERVVLGTIAAESPELLQELVGRFSTRICVGIDARDGRVMTRGWETGTVLTPVELARKVAQAGVKRIIYTDISRDGTMVGPNIEEIRAVAQAANTVVTASGGVSSLDDLRRLRDAHVPLLDSVIVGKALYEERFKLEEAVRVLSSPRIL